jgi:hypothetical protein
VGSIQIYRQLMKGCHVRGLSAGSVHRVYVDCVESVRVMLIGFSHVGCTSIRIIATLEYEYRLFVTVFM